MSRLQAVREGLNYSRRIVATQLGMSEKTLERWEKGGNVKRVHLLALAEIYGVTVEELEDAANAGVAA